MSAEKLFQMIPNIAPAPSDGHQVLCGKTGKPIAGVSKMDVPEWERTKGPTIDEEGWVLLCKYVSELCDSKGSRADNIARTVNPGAIFHTETVMKLMAEKDNVPKNHK